MSAETFAPATVHPQADTGHRDRADTEARRSLFITLAPILRDIAIPVAAYYTLHALGYSDFLALLAGTLVSFGIFAYEALRSRRIDAFGVILLGVFLFGLVSSLITGDPRMMIVKESFGTVIVGAAFLISTVVGKPMTYLAARKAVSMRGPAALTELESQYDAVPAMRRTYRLLAVMWGIGLLAEAVVRVMLAYQLPVSVMAWLSSVLMLAVMGPMIAVTIFVAKRADR